MEEKKLIKDMDWLRKDIIGRNKLFGTPFGKRPLIYTDYTASGRSLYSIENYMMHIMQYYANTHTEDDFTGKTMTELLHDSEKIIKKLVNASKSGKIIFTESGTTGGITRLQQILGVFWPPATKKRINKFLESCAERYPRRNNCRQELQNYIQNHKPIVFVGPYEHHSNEIMWRQTLCDVEQIPLNEEGKLDLNSLEKKISDPKYANRPKIGSFSAASNVTGIKTPVYEVARILHKHNALACFDFAACAPYIKIDMNKNEESYFDAIFLSPHKFLGGPGTAGILIINEKIYPKDLPPCIAAGGTVDYVSLHREKYIEDIETREKPGTPAIIQDIKSALIFQLKEKIGIENIEKIEKYFIRNFYDHFKNNDNIEFYGPTDENDKIAVIPFNIKHKDRLLHPKFVTKLMNDLFGIQTRAGCSCAGPYGHRLLHISDEISRYYQCLIGVDKYSGLKPGWVRLNLHYTFSEAEFDFILQVLDFMSKKAHLFLTQYQFDFRSGDWENINKNSTQKPLDLDIENAYQIKNCPKNEEQFSEKDFSSLLKTAKELAKELTAIQKFDRFDDILENLMFFYVVNYTNSVPSFVIKTI